MQKISNRPCILSPSSKDVDFLGWHLKSLAGKEIPIGQSLFDNHQHSVSLKYPASKLGGRKKKKIGASDSLLSKASKDSLLSSSHCSSWPSKEDTSRCFSKPGSGHSASSPELKLLKVPSGKTHRKRVPKPCVPIRAYADPVAEQNWADSIFDDLPRAPVRVPVRPAARLTNQWVTPDPNEAEQTVPAWSVRQRVSSAAPRRTASIESGPSSVSGGCNRDDDRINSRERQITDFDALNRRSSKGRTATKPERSQGSHSHSEIADLAHRWVYPLSTVQESSKYFLQYAVLPDYKTDGDILKHGILGVAEMEKLVSKLGEVLSLDESAATTTEILGIMDSNNDGAVDFEEFTAWYHERTFMEYMNLSKSEIEVRRVGAELGLCPTDMDFYKKQFDTFDTDGSGHIDLPEFREIMHVVMKVKPPLRIPESRIVHFWRECDVNGDKNVDLKEFVTFYINHFDPNASDPMEDFYKGIRRSVM